MTNVHCTFVIVITPNNYIVVFHQGAAEEAARPRVVAGPSGVSARPREVQEVPLSTDTEEEEEGGFVRPPPKSTPRQRSALENIRPHKRGDARSPQDDPFSQVNVILICARHPETHWSKTLLRRLYVKASFFL